MLFQMVGQVNVQNGGLQHYTHRYALRRTSSFSRRRVIVNLEGGSVPTLTSPLSLNRSNILKLPVPLNNLLSLMKAQAYVRHVDVAFLALAGLRS